MKRLEGLVVVHLADFQQLLCLLRSIDIFLVDIFQCFKVVVQGSEDDYFVIERLLSNRDFSKKLNLQVFPQHHFIRKTENLNGWQIQQALKIFATHNSSADGVVIIDAKHVFLKKMTLEDYCFDGLYKMPVTTQAIHIGKNRGEAFMNCYKFFDLDWRNYIDKSLPTVTPFIFDTLIVRDLYRYVERKVSVDFESFFLSNLNIYTEFYFYGAYVNRLNALESIYVNVNNFNPIFWGGENDVANQFQSLTRDGRIQSIGLHRRFIEMHRPGIMKNLIAPFLISLGVKEFKYWMADSSAKCSTG